MNRGKKIYKVKNPKSPQPESKRRRRYLVAAMPLPRVSAGGQGQDTETGRSGGIHSHGHCACRLPDGRKKPRERKHVVYRLLSSSLPLQSQDSHERGYLTPSRVRGRQEGGKGHTGQACRHTSTAHGTPLLVLGGEAGGGERRREDLPGACG